MQSWATLNIDYEDKLYIPCLSSMSDCDNKRLSKPHTRWVILCVNYARVERVTVRGHHAHFLYFRGEIENILQEKHFTKIYKTKIQISLPDKLLISIWQRDSIRMLSRQNLGCNITFFYIVEKSILPFRLK